MPAGTPTANWRRPSAAETASLQRLQSARPASLRRRLGAAIGRTPPPGLLSAVSLESASAAAAASGRSPVATRASTSWSASSAVGEARSIRQCSHRPPPSAAPLPLGVRRKTCFVTFLQKGDGAGPGRGAGARGAGARGSRNSWRISAVSKVCGANLGLARSTMAREYSSESALRRTASARKLSSL